jgi:hypothetical protein
MEERSSMPGVGTKFVATDRVRDTLDAGGSAHAAAFTSPDSLPYAYLGATGSAFTDLMPARPEVGDADPNSRYFRALWSVLTLLAGDSTVTPNTPGVYFSLQTLRSTLDDLGSAIANRDKFALIGLRSRLEALPDLINGLKASLNTLTTARTTIAINVFQSRPAEKIAPSSDWRVRDTLQMSRTGRYLESLTAGAQTSGDPLQEAFRLGSIVGYSVDVCGNGFVNSIVDAPYRNQWWRHRWISNYVDTWVWGFYGLGGGGSVSVNSTGDPAPPYTTWPNIGKAQLHRRIETAGITPEAVLNAIRGRAAVPGFLPPDFVQYWLEAYKETYGVDPRSAGIDEAAVQSAYAMLYLVLWLQTSGDFLPCIPPDQINYPDGCGVRPPWVAVDGSVVVGGTTLATPPSPGTPLSPDVGEIVSGILLAILGVVELFTGNVAGGILTIIGGVALIADGATEPNWDELGCFYGWVLVYLQNFYNALHDLLKFGAFGFPYTAELAHNAILFSLSGTVSPADAALNTARSRGQTKTYPRRAWNPLASNWTQPPSEPLEPPAEVAYTEDPQFPWHFVDGLSAAGPAPALSTQRNPLNVAPSGTPLVRDPTVWDDRRVRLDTEYLVRDSGLFGNAIGVAVDLIEDARPEELLDWDRDSDPGIGFPTWLLGSPGSPRSQAIPE